VTGVCEPRGDRTPREIRMTCPSARNPDHTRHSPTDVSDTPPIRPPSTPVA
jgi:hypothetical protein